MAGKKAVIGRLMDSLGGKFSSELGIKLSGAKSGEVFKWFLASKLFGARISTAIAMKTYREFERRGVVTPWAVQRAGWDRLVETLDAGGYVRYDFSTATKLLGITKDLLDIYGGDLFTLYRESGDAEDLRGRLKALGKGIGDVTVDIFLREMRAVWPGAGPGVSIHVTLAAERLALIGPDEKDPLKTLEGVWSRWKIKGRDFPDFEAALLKLGKDFCRRQKSSACPLGEECGCTVILKTKRTEMAGAQRDWEKLYRAESVEAMPWYYPGLDPDLKRALKGLKLASGSALDLCTGPGTQAFALSGLGFRVTAMDISGTAVRKAVKKAREEGLKIDFIRKDFLKAGMKDKFDLVFDRGCFHTLPPGLRGDYLGAIGALIRPGGYLFLKCFSHIEKMEGGPYRFTPGEIRGLFGKNFKILSIRHTVYQGTLKPLPKALFCVLQKAKNLAGNALS